MATIRLRHSTSRCAPMGFGSLTVNKGADGGRLSLYSLQGSPPPLKDKIGIVDKSVNKKWRRGRDSPPTVSRNFLVPNDLRVFYCCVKG